MTEAGFPDVNVEPVERLLRSGRHAEANRRQAAQGAECRHSLRRRVADKLRGMAVESERTDREEFSKLIADEQKMWPT